jgi:uncharacterized DUF497 family protein
MTKFEWDLRKAQVNMRKHRVSFEEAATATLDEFSRTPPDPDHSISENRFVALGLSARGRLLVVYYTERGNSVRIITARTVTRQERKPRPGMKLTAVKSSMLRAVGYDRKTNEMEVVFNTGDAYRYENVPPSKYADLLKAESKGTYMQAHIINVFPYHRVKTMK